MTHQEQPDEADRRHGEFCMIAEAEDPDQAIRMFRDRIVAFRNTRQFFEGLCKVFLNQLLEFDEFPKSNAAMLTYKSVAGDPMMPFIHCTVPTDQQDWCSIHEWNENWPQVDGQGETLFIEFKEEPPRKELTENH